MNVFKVELLDGIKRKFSRHFSGGGGAKKKRGCDWLLVRSYYLYCVAFCVLVHCKELKSTIAALHFRLLYVICNDF
jgi:hypothetical protein